MRAVGAVWEEALAPYSQYPVIYHPCAHCSPCSSDAFLWRTVLGPSCIVPAETQIGPRIKPDREVLCHKLAGCPRSIASGTVCATRGATGTNRSAVGPAG